MFLGYAFSIDYRDRRGHAYMLHGPGADAAPDQAAVGLVPALPRLGDAAVPQARQRRRQGGPRRHPQADVPGDAREAARRGRRASRLLRRLPRSEDDEAARHAAGLHRRHPGARRLRTRRCRTCRPSSSGARAAARSPTTRTSTPRATRCARSSAASATSSTTARPRCRCTFPWSKGLRAADQEKLWNETKFPDGEQFFDYKHAETGAKVLKAQHPEFELWSQGVHARSGVSCADCHMPYMRDGATKVSDHWVRSPLLNVNRACQTCHHFSGGGDQGARRP